MEFMRNLPTRKVNGVGRVFERELDAIGIKTCGDIYTHRAYLSIIWRKASNFLCNVISVWVVQKFSLQKSTNVRVLGRSLHFRELSGKTELREKCGTLLKS